MREIQRINEQELKLGIKGASWHDEYKGAFCLCLHLCLSRAINEVLVSAYRLGVCLRRWLGPWPHRRRRHHHLLAVRPFLFPTSLNSTPVLNLNVFALACAIRYGEVMDVNLPREKETGKTRGFGFLMYEDQRSTVLAVDNLNGASVAGRTLRVDHVKNYKQSKVKGEDGEMVEREEQSLNAKPEVVGGESWLRHCDVGAKSARACLSISFHVDGDEDSEESESSGPEIDPEDPMAAYMLQKRKEEKQKQREGKKGSKKSKSSKHKDETPEERRARKERKRAKKAQKQDKKSSGLRGVEEMLERMNAGAPGREDRKREREGGRSRSPTGPRRTSPRSRTPDPRDREYGEPPRRARSPEDRGERGERDDGRRRAKDGSRERHRDSGRFDRDSRRSPDTREARRRDARHESRSKSPS